jgi:hypothetical protein
MEISNNDAPTGFLAGLAGRTRAEVCAAVHAAGGGAYGKWLGTTTDPTSTITCKSVKQPRLGGQGVEERRTLDGSAEGMQDVDESSPEHEVEFLAGAGLCCG